MRGQKGGGCVRTVELGACETPRSLLCSDGRVEPLLRLAFSGLRLNMSWTAQHRLNAGGVWLWRERRVSPATRLPSRTSRSAMSASALSGCRACSVRACLSIPGTWQRATGQMTVTGKL